MKKESAEELAIQLDQIRGADLSASREAAAYVQSLAAPPGSLGKLTDAAVQLAGITGKVKNTLGRRSQALNMTRHLTGMSSLAAHFGIDTEIVDIGIATPYEEQGCKILQRRIRRGTANLAKEPAMTRDQTVQAVLVGIERAKQAAADGIDVIGVGEMGIGNTTTSSAVLAALTGLSVEDVTGRGGGLTDAAFEKKKNIISQALRLHGLAGTACDAGFAGAAGSSGVSSSAGFAGVSSAAGSSGTSYDPIEVLSRVGGLDLAGMCGVYLGAAICRIPVVIDGFISIVAALCAQRLSGSCRDFMFPSHVSEEIGYMRAAQELHLDPWLHLNMRLGEGSGCPLAFQILEASCALMNEMATFEQAKIDDGYLAELRAMQK